jgi:hypothetical protein
MLGKCILIPGLFLLPDFILFPFFFFSEFLFSVFWIYSFQVFILTSDFCLLTSLFLHI